MIVRPATQEDIEAFAPNRDKPSLRAWLGEVDGKIAALGGVARVKGRWFAFFDIEPEGRPYKVTIVRAARRFFEELKSQGIKFIYAEADTNEPNAVRWMTSLGFTLDPRSRTLYRWRG